MEAIRDICFPQTPNKHSLSVLSLSLALALSLALFLSLSLSFSLKTHTYLRQVNTSCAFFEVVDGVLCEVCPYVLATNEKNAEKKRAPLGTRAEF
jgi:hypothetical protein